MRSSSPVAILAERDRLLVSICLVLTIALAWAYLIRLAHQMAPATAHGYGDGRDGHDDECAMDGG